MNLACGVLGISRPLFIMSTFVGIFFDVTVLASVGASLRAEGYITALFFLLLAVFMMLRSLLFKSSARVRISS